MPEQHCDLGLFEGLPFLLAVLEQGSQGASADQLHLDHQAGLALVKSVELHDVWMVKRRQDLCLLGEEADLGGSHGLFGDGLECREKYLKGVVFVVLGVEAGIHLREGAGAEQMAHLEAQRRKLQHTTQIILFTRINPEYSASNYYPPSQHYQSMQLILT